MVDLVSVDPWTTAVLQLSLSLLVVRMIISIKISNIHGYVLVLLSCSLSMSKDLLTNGQIS